jgi:hypothetical protein
LALAWEFGLDGAADAEEATAVKTAIEPAKIDCAIRMGSSPNGLKSHRLKIKNNWANFGQREAL